MKPLVIDVGGTNIKVCVRGEPDPIIFESSSTLTPRRLVQRVKSQTAGWEFDHISLGVPTIVKSGEITTEPSNLGRGWLNFDFSKAFGKPVRIINDAAMQAMGAYDGGRMLFLGFGTGLGAAVVSQSVVLPLELCELELKRGNFEKQFGHKGFLKLGRPAWRKAVIATAKMLQKAFAADYVVLGGAKAGAGLLDPLPANLRRGRNEDAFTGGFRLWEHTVEPHDRAPSIAWRVLH